MIRSAWIIRPNENVPWLVTCNILSTLTGGANPMTKPREPKMLDLIAVTSSAPESEVTVGDVGTVIELLPPDGLEVEFLDRDGRTNCVATLKANDVLVLNRERTQVA
jgi:hypothetical protein